MDDTLLSPDIAPPDNWVSGPHRLSVRAAWLYYMEDLTQQEIAEHLGLSRVKVNRLLAEARDSGLVQISIRTLSTTFPEIEEALCKKYALRDAVVTVESEEGPPMYRLLAQGTAEWLIPRLATNVTVGLSLGRTISYLPTAFRPPRRVPCTFIEVIGGLSNSVGGFGGYNVIAKMAESCGGRVELLNVPTVVSSADTRRLLMEEQAVSRAFDKARHCQILLASAGPLNESALLFKHGYLTDGDLANLRQRGAVGDVLGRFVDPNGDQVHYFLDDRLMSLELDDMRNIQFRVLIGGGQDKIAPMRAVSKSGLFNVLITDLQTAQALMMAS